MTFITHHYDRLKTYAKAHGLSIRGAIRQLVIKSLTESGY